MMVLSCLVVFVTTYLLILPAITLDQDEAEKQGGIDVPKQTRQIEDVPVKDLDLDSDSKDPGSNAIVLKTEPDVQAGSISYTGKGYEVSADCDGAGLPEGTELTAEEISKSDDAYDGLYDDALEAVQKDSGNEDCDLRGEGRDDLHGNVYERSVYGSDEDRREYRCPRPRLG